MIRDAIDDLVDLSLDFEDVIWRFQNTSVDDALWNFVESYRAHCRWHIREFQFYLYRRTSGE